MVSMEHKGEIAKLRTIVRHLDAVLSMCENDDTFQPHNSQATREMIQDTLKARLCASNMLMSYGDDSAYKSQPSLKLSVEFR